MKKLPNNFGSLFWKNSAPTIAYRDVTRHTRANAFNTGRIDCKSAAVILRKDGMRLKRRNTRKHRISRSCAPPGKVLNKAETKEVPTTRESNQFHGSLKKSHTNVANIFTDNSNVQQIVKNVSKSENIAVCSAE